MTKQPIKIRTLQNRVEIYDNGGRTIDRYTVILDNTEVFAMSDNPLNYNGFNQYSGDIGTASYNLDATLCRKGTKLTLKDVNEDVQKAIKERAGIE